MPTRQTTILAPTEQYPGLFEAICIAMDDMDGIDVAELEENIPGQAMKRWLEFLERHRDPQNPTKYTYTREDVRQLADELFTFPIRKILSHYEAPPDETKDEYCERIYRLSVRRPWKNTSGQIGVEYEVFEPGGRFGHPEEDYGRIYYWDCWPSNRGALKTMGKWGLEKSRSTIKALEQLAEKLDGNIPNVNAPWGAKRSQPPVLHRMLKELAEYEGQQILQEFLPLMELHYGYWQRGIDKLGTEPGTTHLRLVRMPNGKVMYRHWDDGEGPRDEMWIEDMRNLRDLEKNLGRKATGDEKWILFKSLRACAESGEDFNVAETRDYKNLYSLHTIEYTPIKLNALMYEFALTLADTYLQKADRTPLPEQRQIALRRAGFYEKQALDLADCIHQYCLSEDDFCGDFDFVQYRTEPGNCLDGVFALSAGVFSFERGQRMLDVVDARFLKEGGLISTTYPSDEQWDSNAWPILQLDAVDAAVRYERFDLALKWCRRWLDCNAIMFREHHLLYEKSDAHHAGQPGGKGEYDCVPNLLMTLGVDMSFRAMLPWLQKMAATTKGTGQQPKPLNQPAGSLPSL